MRHLVILLLTAGALAACNSDSQSQRTLGGGLVGAGAGAAVGSLTASNSRRGAAVGAAVGGVGGALIGRASTPNNCLYRHTNGSVFEGPCP